MPLSVPNGPAVWSRPHFQYTAAAIFCPVYTTSQHCTPMQTPNVCLAVQSSFQQILHVAVTKAVCSTHWMCFTRIRCIERTDNMKLYTQVTYLCKIPRLSRIKMTGTKTVVNSMILRNTNSIIRSRILLMVVDFSFINYNSSFHQDF